MTEKLDTIETFFVGMEPKDFEQYKDNQSKYIRNQVLGRCSIKAIVVTLEVNVREYKFHKKEWAEDNRRRLSEDYEIPIEKMHIYKTTETLIRTD